MLADILQSIFAVNKGINYFLGKNRVDYVHYLTCNSQTERKDITPSVAFKIFPDPFELEHNIIPLSVP